MKKIWRNLAGEEENMEKSSRRGRKYDREKYFI